MTEEPEIAGTPESPIPNTPLDEDTPLEIEVGGEAKSEPAAETDDVEMVPVPDKAAEDEELDDPLDVLDLDALAKSQRPENAVEYLPHTVDLRGTDDAAVLALFQASLERNGAAVFDALVRTPGSHENLLYRDIMEGSHEEKRIREFLGTLPAELRSSEALSNILKRGDEVVLKNTYSMTGKKVPKGETRVLTGPEAIVAFASAAVSSIEGKTSSAGSYRIMLHNSGVSLDLRVPTGNDFEILLQNCFAIDRDFGAVMGAHYFSYADAMIKARIYDFIYSLIVNSSYDSWNKKGMLWQVLKFPDLSPLVMSIAALIYRKGFEGFSFKCTRPIDAEHPVGCSHTETLTIDLLKMIVTRWPVLSQSSIEYLTKVRSASGAVFTLQDIIAYQKSLGLEGEEISFRGFTFTMRIPTFSEYLEAAQKFLSDISNEIEGDNSDGKYRMIGLRYIRSFIPWIEKMRYDQAEGGATESDEPGAIELILDRLGDLDDDGTFQNKLVEYVNKVQLTYVGYPATKCPTCGHIPNTPSGLMTIDPFTTFFTIASKSTM